MKERRLAWAIAGTGTSSRSIVQDLRGLGEDVDLVFSRSPDNVAAFAHEHGIPRWTADYDEFLNQRDIDVVYIATPFVTHHRLAIAALRAGHNVVVEKPMATSEREAAEIFDVAEASGRFVMEAMWFKFNPAVVRLLELLAEGAIGEPRSIRAGFGFPLPRDGGSRWDPSRSPGGLLDQGIYPVTLAHAILGTPTTVQVRGRVQPDGIDLTAHVALAFEGETSAQFTSSIEEFADPSASIAGTSGWIRIPGMFWAARALEVHAGGWREMFESPRRIEFPFDGNGYRPMLRSIGTRVRSGRTVHDLHDRSSTLAVFRTLDAIRDALPRGR